MKKIFCFIITVVIISSQAFAQTKNSTECTYLSYAYSNFCQKKYKKTIKALEVFRLQYPKHPLVEEAQYAIGLSYFNKGDEKKAAKTFQHIIDKSDYPYPDSVFEISNCFNNGKPCNSGILIADFSLNIQHEACLRMADIGFKQKNIQWF